MIQWSSVSSRFIWLAILGSLSKCTLAIYHKFYIVLLPLLITAKPGQAYPHRVHWYNSYYCKFIESAMRIMLQVKFDFRLKYLTWNQIWPVTHTQSVTHTLWVWNSSQLPFWTVSIIRARVSYKKGIICLLLIGELRPFCRKPCRLQK